MRNPKSTLQAAILGIVTKSAITASSVAAGTALLLACGAEADLDDPLAREAESEEEGLTPNNAGAENGGAENGEGVEDDGAEPNAGLPADLALALEREAQAPGYVPSLYPAAPYGFVQGSTIANFDFLGWSAPTSTNFDLAQLRTIDFASFYDPDGQKGIELLMVSAVAVWCGVCQAEYLEMRDSGVYAEYRPRGLEMLGILFEDADAAPATYTDLQNWTRVFEVNFPFVLDPALKMGVFFDRSATPMNMVVDAKTMQVLVSITGYNPEIFELIDRELTARGR